MEEAEEEEEEVVGTAAWKRLYRLASVADSRTGSVIGVIVSSDSHIRISNVCARVGSRGRGERMTRRRRRIISGGECSNRRHVVALCTTVRTV